MTDADARSTAAKPGLELDYLRRDYCPSCPPQAGEVLVASWRARRPAPADKGRRAFDPTATFELFEQLDAALAGSAHSPVPTTAQQLQTAAEQLQLRFLLALLLWRKRILKLTGQGEPRRQTDGNPDSHREETWEFYHPRTEQTFRVLRPAIDDAQLARAGSRLEEVLAGGSVLRETSDAGIQHSGQTD